MAEDRINISPNARDLRLFANSLIHPGAIIIEPLARDVTLRLIFLGIAFAEAQQNSDLYMINRVIEVSQAGGVVPYLMPTG